MSNVPPAARLIWSALLCALLALGLPASARANGTPINVVLSYQSGVSNWGPTNATGVAELVMGEGEARLSASGLPRLESEQYQLWLLSAAGEALPLATFNASDQQVARVDEVLPRPIPEQDWSLLLVTVEPAGAQPSAPGERHSIAGRLPEPATGQARPAELPRTGGSERTAPASPAAAPAPASSPLGPRAAILGLAAIAAIGGVGFALGRLTARRTT